MSAIPPADAIRAPCCPLCRRLAAEMFRPFCSKRCADLDLSRWLKGIYAIPARAEDEGDDEGDGDGEGAAGLPPPAPPRGSA